LKITDGEIVVDRSLPLMRGVFLACLFVAGVWALRFSLFVDSLEGWHPGDLYFVQQIAFVMGAYWILYSGWQLYSGLSSTPQIETGPQGVRLFRFVKFYTPWKNIKAIEPAVTGFIGPHRNVLPGNILPYGAHARFKPPISKSRRFVAIELNDADNVVFDSKFHQFLFIFNSLKNITNTV